MIKCNKIILGGGNAAGYAAYEYVKLGGEKGNLMIISNEKDLPYERPALSKGYLKKDSPARLPGFHTCVGGGLPKLTAEWYDQHDIRVMLNTNIVTADVVKKQLTSEKGDLFEYKELIVATGARSRQLKDVGVDLKNTENVYYLRDVKDADGIYAQMKARNGQRAVVIGGGYIGMECSTALSLNGIETSMICNTEHLLARLLPADIAQFYEDEFEKRNVKIVRNAKAVDIRDEDGKKIVVLKDGSTIDADFVIVGVGAIGNTELFQGQLEMDKGGIKVNGQLKSNNDSVYAIGDVATFPLVRNNGAMVRLEHVDNARKMASFAMQVLLNKKDEVMEYEYLPYFYSRIFDYSWKFYGDVTENCTAFTHGEQGYPGAYWVKDNRIVGAFLESASDDDYAKIQKITQEKVVVQDMNDLAKGLNI